MTSPSWLTETYHGRDGIPALPFAIKRRRAPLFSALFRKGNHGFQPLASRLLPDIL
jgi:hypothetical protein